MNIEKIVSIAMPVLGLWMMLSGVENRPGEQEMIIAGAVLIGSWWIARHIKSD